MKTCRKIIGWWLNASLEAIGKDFWLSFHPSTQGFGSVWRRWVRSSVSQVHQSLRRLRFTDTSFQQSTMIAMTQWSRNRPRCLWIQRHVFILAAGNGWNLSIFRFEKNWFPKSAFSRIKLSNQFFFSTKNGKIPTVSRSQAEDMFDLIFKLEAGNKFNCRCYVTWSHKKPKSSSS